MNSLDLWRLAERLTVVQAALLMCDQDPSSFDYQDDLGQDPTKGPPGFAAAFAAVRTARGLKVDVYDHRGEPPDADGGFVPCWTSSYVKADALKNWLVSKGVTTGFFFPEPSPDVGYLDAKHERYAPKLAAAVSAWLAVKPAGNQSPKQLLEKWLRENAKHFSLTHPDGSLVNAAIDECATVANWRPQGGAPATGALNLAPLPIAPRKRSAHEEPSPTTGKKAKTSARSKPLK